MKIPSRSRWSAGHLAHGGKRSRRASRPSKQPVKNLAVCRCGPPPPAEAVSWVRCALQVSYCLFIGTPFNSDICDNPGSFSYVLHTHTSPRWPQHTQLHPLQHFLPCYGESCDSSLERNSQDITEVSYCNLLLTLWRKMCSFSQKATIISSVTPLFPSLSLSIYIYECILAWIFYFCESMTQSRYTLGVWDEKGRIFENEFRPSRSTSCCS